MWTEESALLSAKEVIKDFSRPDDYLKVRMTTKKQAQCLYLEGGHFLQALIIAEVQKTIKLLWAKTELFSRPEKKRWYRVGFFYIYLPRTNSPCTPYINGTFSIRECFDKYAFPTICTKCQ
jgi:hypothetical protein